MNLLDIDLSLDLNQIMTENVIFSLDQNWISQICDPWFDLWEIPYQIIQKKSKSTPSPDNFLFFGPWLDTVKLHRNPKFQVLRSSGTLLSQWFRIGPLDQIMTATIQK